MKNIILSLVAGSAIMVSGVVQATPINGAILIGNGGASVVVDTTLNTVDFTPNAGNALVNVRIGDFLAIAPSASASYSDFTYSLGAVSVSPVWITLGGPPTASFDLTWISSITETASGVILAGSGIAYLTGKDPTPGEWSFSADTTGGIFNWSSTTAVPDGGMTLVLLGTALTAMGLIRRKMA